MSKKKIIGIFLVLFIVAVVFIVIAVGKDGEEEATTVMMPPQVLISEPTAPTQTPTPKSTPTIPPVQAPTPAPNLIPASASPIPLNMPFLIKGVKVSTPDSAQKIVDFEATVLGSTFHKNTYAGAPDWMIVDVRIKILGTPREVVFLDLQKFHVYGKKGEIYLCSSGTGQYTTIVEKIQNLLFYVDNGDSDFILTWDKYGFLIK